MIALKATGAIGDDGRRDTEDSAGGQKRKKEERERERRRVNEDETKRGRGRERERERNKKRERERERERERWRSGSMNRGCSRCSPSSLTTEIYYWSRWSAVVPVGQWFIRGT